MTVLIERRLQKCWPNGGAWGGLSAVSNMFIPSLSPWGKAVYITCSKQPCERLLVLFQAQQAKLACGLIMMCELVPWQNLSPVCMYGTTGGIYFPFCSWLFLSPWPHTKSQLSQWHVYNLQTQPQTGQVHSKKPEMTWTFVCGHMVL